MCIWQGFPRLEGLRRLLHHRHGHKPQAPWQRLHHPLPQRREVHRRGTRYADHNAQGQGLRAGENLRPDLPRQLHDGRGGPPDPRRESGRCGERRAPARHGRQPDDTGRTGYDRHQPDTATRGHSGRRPKAAVCRLACVDPPTPRRAHRSPPPAARRRRTACARPPRFFSLRPPGAFSPAHG